MGFEYDLVVIGGGSVARHTAIAAAKARLRVGLVSCPGARGYSAHDIWAQLGQWNQGQMMQVHPQDAPQGKARIPDGRLDPRVLLSLASERDQPRGFLPTLAAQGIDWVETAEPLDWERTGRSPILRTTDPNRRFESAYYLLLPDGLPPAPSVPGGTSPLVWGVAEAWKHLIHLESPLPPSVAIIGDGPWAILWSQCLAQLGLQVTVLTPKAQLLPQEDGEVAAWVHSSLEAMGVRVWCRCSLSIQAVDGKGVVSTPAGPLTVDQLLWLDGGAAATAFEQVLNLESLGLQPKSGLAVNPFLQTRHPRIYASGEILGGYALPEVAQREAAIALGNILGRSRSRRPQKMVDYRFIPWRIPSIPEVVRVGQPVMAIEEASGQSPLAQSPRILRQVLTSMEAPPNVDPTLLCKVLVSRQDRILGATLVGPVAACLIDGFAWAIQRGERIQALSSFPTLATDWPQLVTMLDCHG
jgi:pyruvate/2-oxoglutarate dehydrogenase complex dihydrolipoamide dehydrogenase (E3) component